MFVILATGISTIIYYTPFIFEISGFESKEASIGETVCKGIKFVFLKWRITCFGYDSKYKYQIHKHVINKINEVIHAVHYLFLSNQMPEY